MSYNHDQYTKKLEVCHKGFIKIIGYYTKMRDKSRYRCTKCNHKWTTIAEALVRKNKPTGCPKCNGGSGLDRKTHKEYKKEVFIKSKGLVKVLEKYVDNVTKIEHQCVNCNNTYKCVPLKITCVACRNKLNTKTHKQYIREVGTLFKGDIEVVDTYINAKTKIGHYCNNCNMEWYAWPTHVLKGVGCPNCCTGGNPYKKFKLGNRQVNVQGHEDIVLSHLIKRYRPSQIRVFSEGVVPKIPYNKGKNHHPDIFIPHVNTLIEVKGNASLGMIEYHNAKTEQARKKLFKSVQNKAVAAINLGYSYELHLVQPNKKIKKLPENWQHLSYAKFRKLWLKFKND